MSKAKFIITINNIIETIYFGGNLIPKSNAEYICDINETGSMKDFRNEWFFNQHYSKDELEQLWEWVQ